MNSIRFDAAAAKLKDGKLLVTGGGNDAEMLTEEGWESNIPYLPVAIVDAHCMVTINSTTVMVIGGRQNNHDWSQKTFYFTFGDESWTEGPELKNKRAYHSCGKIRRNKDSQEMSIIVAGVPYLPSVEILDEDSNEWQTGPKLPLGIAYSQMVEDPNGGVALIGGYSPSNGYLKTLYQLPHGGQDAAWTKIKQKLQTGRQYHTAFMVPDNIVDCS